MIIPRGTSSTDPMRLIGGVAISDEPPADSLPACFISLSGRKRALAALAAAALTLLVGCNVDPHSIRYGVIQALDLEEPCAVTIAPVDPMTVYQVTTFEVPCDRIPERLVPGDIWPPSQESR